MAKQISQAQQDYHTYRDQLLDTPGNNVFKSHGLPVSMVDYDNVLLYTSVKAILKNCKFISIKDKNLFVKFSRLWITHKGNLKAKYQAQVQAKLTYYQNKLYNQTMKKRRLQRRAQKKSV